MSNGQIDRSQSQDRLDAIELVLFALRRAKVRLEIFRDGFQGDCAGVRAHTAFKLSDAWRGNSTPSTLMWA